MTTAGVDTVSLAWRPPDNEFMDALLATPHRPSGGGLVAFKERGPGGTWMGAAPSHNLVIAEGRLGAMVHDSEGEYGLQEPSAVLAAEVSCRLAFGFLANRFLDGQAEVRRFDLAVEHEFADRLDGLAFLRTVAGMNAPRRKTWPAINGGTVETVYFRQAKSNVVTERVYDKGLESGSHRPGERIRIEAQRRPQKANRFSPDTFASLVDLGAEFGRSIIPSLAQEELVAAGSNAATEMLVQKAAAGELSIAKAERLIGSTVIMSQYGRAFYPDVQQQQRRVRELREEVGLVVDNVIPAGHLVPVGQLLREAVEAFR
jgi:hypothetical protein